MFFECSNLIVLCKKKIYIYIYKFSTCKVYTFILSIFIAIIEKKTLRYI